MRFTDLGPPSGKTVVPLERMTLVGRHVENPTQCEWGPGCSNVPTHLRREPGSNDWFPACADHLNVKGDE
jgi:hypothetical protein